MPSPAGGNFSSGRTVSVLWQHISERSTTSQSAVVCSFDLVKQLSADVVLDRYERSESGIRLTCKAFCMINKQSYALEAKRYLLILVRCHANYSILFRLAFISNRSHTELWNIIKMGVYCRATFAVLFGCLAIFPFRQSNTWVPCDKTGECRNIAVVSIKFAVRFIES